MPRYPRQLIPGGVDPFDENIDWLMLLRMKRALQRALQRKLEEGTERKHVRRPNARPVIAREIERDD